MKPSARPVARTRQMVLDLWSRTRIDWGFASDKIAETFRRHRELGASERRVIAETLYGMIRMARRVDFALEQAGARVPPGPRREEARYVAYRLLSGEIDARAATAELEGIDWKKVARVDEAIAHERGAERRLALRRSFPDWLARRFMTQYGDAEADALAAAMNARAPLTLRVNTLRTTRDALAARLEKEDGLDARPTKMASNGLVLDTRVNVFGLAAFKEGLFEAQDEASQLVAELVAPAGAKLVVDACAGAGGKTLALGAAMKNKGRLVALDVDGKKLEELRRRARRAGLTNAQAIQIEADSYPEEARKLEGKADRVLVDAPCSGVGALRRNPEARWRLGEEDLARLPVQQLAIAKRAAKLVAPGGLFIYATCTVLEEENQAVARQIEASVPGFSRVPVAELVGAATAARVASADGREMVLLPNRHDTDGFYAAAFRRVS